LFGLIKKCWHDPVGSKVIATSITGAAGACIYFFDWWPTIVQASKAIVGFVFSSTAVPNWLIGILITPVLLVLVVVGLIIRNKRHPTQYSVPWINYTADNFFNVRWTWRYDGANQIIDLYSFCPSCDFQIYPRRYLNFVRDFTHINYHCENCRRDFGNFSDDIAQFENKIIRHIQRKIRNGEWMNAQSTN
jgi:hypothetical protein